MFLAGQVVIVILTPLVLAGLGRVILDRRKLLAWPLDFGLKLGDKRLFGSGKTWGGLIILTTLSWFFGWILANSTNLEQFNLTQNYGLWLGLTYTCGEIINSFIKRRLAIEPNTNAHGWKAGIQYFFDQVDSVLSICILLLFWQVPFWWLLLPTGFLTHCLIDILNHGLGSKKYTDKHGLFAFYQLLAYGFFKITLGSWITGPRECLPKNHNKIITSNHPFFADSLILLASLTPSDFLRLVPFRFLVSRNYMRGLLGFWIWLTGGYSDRWKLFEDRPIDKSVKFLQDDYNLLMLYEGRFSQAKKESGLLKKGILKIASKAGAGVYAFRLNPSLIGWKVTYQGKLDDSEPMEISQLNDLVYNQSHT